jgi:hypothetical protein
MVVEASEEQCEIHQVALSNLDGDGPQYITSNTLDEAGHATFLNAYLESRGAEPVNFSQFESGWAPAGCFLLGPPPQPDSHQSW